MGARLVALKPLPGRGSNRRRLLFQLFRDHYPRLVRYCSACLHDLEAGRDVAHNVLIKAVRHLPDATEDPWPWLCRVARNECIDELRKPRAVPLETISDEEAPETPEEYVMSRLELKGLHTAIDDLPQRHQQLLHLAYWEEMSYEQISGHLGLSVASVRDRLYYARRLLKSNLRRMGAQFIVLPLARLREWASPILSLLTPETLMALLVIPIAVSALTTTGSPSSVPAGSPVRTAGAELSSTASPQPHPIQAAPARVPAPGPHQQAAGRNLSPALEVKEGGDGESPGSARISIGPITINCSPSGTSPVMSIVCALAPHS